MLCALSYLTFSFLLHVWRVLLSYFRWVLFFLNWRIFTQEKSLLPYQHFIGIANLSLIMSHTEIKSAIASIYAYSWKANLVNFNFSFSSHFIITLSQKHLEQNFTSQFTWNAWDNLLPWRVKPIWQHKRQTQ